MIRLGPNKMTACSWQNKFCDGNSARSVRGFVLYAILSMVIFVLGFFFWQTFAQTFIGLRWWWRVTSFYLHAASGQSLPGFLSADAENNWWSKGDDAEWQRWGLLLPHSASNKQTPWCLFAFATRKKKEISFDHKSMKKPKLTYHVTQNKGFHKWTQRTYQTPNIWKHIAARKAKLPKIPMFATQKHSTFQAPQKNSWLFPAPWNKYCQTSKVPLSMVHQSQIDPNCICPQYEHQTMLRCPYHWSPGHHHAKRWWLWFFYCCELKYIVILYWEEQKDEGAKFQFVELNSNPKASWKQTISMMIPPKNWSGNVWKSNKSSLTTSLFSFSALGWKISRRWSMPLSPSGRRPTSRVWPSDGRCFPCNNPVVPKNTVDGRNPANQLRLVVYPIIFRLLYIPGGAGFLPSTVLAWYLLNTLCWYRLLGYLFPTTTHIFYRFSHWRISSIP